MEYLIYIGTFLLIAVLLYLASFKMKSKFLRWTTILALSLIFSFLAIIFISWKIASAAADFDPVAFDQSKWMQDKQHRIVFAHSLDTCKFIDGRPVTEVLKMLGDADNISDTLITYDLTKGPWREDYFVANFYLYVDKGTVKSHNFQTK